MKVIETIYLDFYQNPYVTVFAKQYDEDTRFVKIYCSKNGEFYAIPNNYNVEVRVLTPDNRAIQNRIKVDSDGGLSLELTESILFYPGKAIVEIVVYNESSTQRLSTMVFYLQINGGAYDENRIIASDEFNALTDLYKKLQNITYEVVSPDEPTLQYGGFWDEEY